MKNLHNLFGRNIVPWRPPLDTLDEKIRPALLKLEQTLVPRIKMEEFRIYRHKDGSVFAELHCRGREIIRSGKKAFSPLATQRIVARFTDNWGLLIVTNESFDALFKTNKAPLDMHEDLYKAAHKWWLGKRPIKWNLREHLKDPTVNCYSRTEDALALAVAEIAFTEYYKRIGNKFS